MKNRAKNDIVVFQRMNKFNYKETFEDADHGTLLLCADHQKTHMLVAGFSSRHFYLHEMPNFNIIHSLSIDDQKQMIASVLFSPLADWIALVCQNLGQLIILSKQEGPISALTFARNITKTALAICSWDKT
ncbi:unnamed protein product [Rotaria sordida]|uniref:Uncharacterized protein n=1 Tax=Rotaria sordida TaxID=392033 RepID=A0A815HGU0_9BILA|nr:unnamed protein product [Rotaria sordida]CAF1271799.1 unnamed protein product [Rotaria sordida]CAF1350602.1 unnamed protein product [Rotaria sordida]CAF1395243.1 unnamed protein product [Rotaria sordida]CAF1551018.1 unnamed protein product [Rotaria sordida]